MYLQVALDEQFALISFKSLISPWACLLLLAFTAPLALLWCWVISSVVAHVAKDVLRNCCSSVGLCSGIGSAASLYLWLLRSWLLIAAALGRHRAAVCC